MRVRCIGSKGLEGYLTGGKVYDVFEVRGNTYVIRDDTGSNDAYYKDRFVFDLAIQNNTPLVGESLMDKFVTMKDSNPKDAIGATKVSMSLLPQQVLAEASLGLTEGALKYGAYNYREIGIRASIYFDACMRHMMRYWEGEDIDPDSGLPHLTKAMDCLIVMRDAQMNGKCFDDRPPKVKNQGFIEELNGKVAELKELYPNPPKPYMEKDDD